MYKYHNRTGWNNLDVCIENFVEFYCIYPTNAQYVITIFLIYIVHIYSTFVGQISSKKSTTHIAFGLLIV
jgi:hypothetical protein